MKRRFLSLVAALAILLASGPGEEMSDAESERSETESKKRRRRSPSSY